MHLTQLEGDFAVCKVASVKDIDFAGDFVFAAKTDDEISLVCRERDLPGGTTVAQRGWRALKVAGPLDFGLVGILASLSGTLAQNGIPLFAVSTFNTDYILVKQEHFEDALTHLRAAGHTIP